MITDKNRKEIQIGIYVKILAVEPHWFQSESNESSRILHEACKKPVLFSDIYDGHVTVDLPATTAVDDQLIGNSITTVPEKLEVACGAAYSNVMYRS